MSVSAGKSWPGVAAWLLTFATGLVTEALAAAPSAAEAAAQMRKAYEHLPQAGALPKRISIESAETPESVEGTVSGVITEPYATVRDTLADPGQWCDILMLHMNNKSCRMASLGEATTITLKIAKRYDQPAEQASSLTFGYRVAQSSPDYLAVRLDAAEGPYWTRDHRIMLEAIPIDGGRTFLRLAYSYGSGMPTRVITDLYFSTAGKGKVGFTEVQPAAAGATQFIGGVRGLMERNAMRYFLAADARLGEHGTAGPKLTERRLRHWFEATERYPRQLRELDLETYLRLKRNEFEARTPAR